jgi:hypothetical protein
MRHPSIKALYAYWSRLKGTRAAPSRSEVDPVALAAHLGDIFLLDGRENAHALRLAGSRMEAELGGSLIGRPFAALFAEDTRAEALHALASATSEGEPILIGVRLEQPEMPASPDTTRPDSGQWIRPHWANRRWPSPPQGVEERRARRPGSGEILLLPLEHRGVIGTRVLGAFGLLSPSLHLPAREVPLRVTGERILGPKALATTGPGLSPGATLVAQHGITRFFRGMSLPPHPENDA